MSTDTQKPPLHTIEQLTRGSVVYLRNALNNPRWTSGLDEHITGCDILRSLPKLTAPQDALVSDEAFLKWSEPIALPVWEINDVFRDACRKALKHAFENKVLPVNDHSTDLIHKFSLKS